ncbi:MAG: hypothetical protein AAGF59_13885, partial [Pseudomonadota bacterium]
DQRGGCAPTMVWFASPVQPGLLTANAEMEVSFMNLLATRIRSSLSTKSQPLTEEINNEILILQHSQKNLLYYWNCSHVQEAVNVPF